MTQKLTIDYTLTDEEFECILEMAGYGCNYWADEMDIADDYKSVTFHDCEGEKSYTINKDDVEKAIVKIAKCEGEIGLHVTNRHLVY